MNSALLRLRDVTAEFSARCVAARWFAQLFWVDTQKVLIADVVEEQAEERRVICQQAYKAEQIDLDAEKDSIAAREELEAALGDGHLDSADVPRVQRALLRLKKIQANARRSAELDHDIADSTR